ncbi:MAG: poly(3-hydroxybutyrate) depolymerase [Verrucomicrobiales bacterium]|jgi:poly(3-hydroxybutyrate) depolymerase
MKRLTILFLTAFTMAQAEHSELSWPELDTTLPLWTSDETPPPNQKWPAIVYFHGTNGRPTIGLIKSATEGKHLVLVGMTFAQQRRFQQTEESISTELSQLNTLKARLVNEQAADPAGIFVAGFSKGGWFTSLLLERDCTLAGGLVLSAGVFHGRNEPDVKPFTTNKAHLPRRRRRSQ